MPHSGLAISVEFCSSYGQIFVLSGRQGRKPHGIRGILIWLLLLLIIVLSFAFFGRKHFPKEAFSFVAHGLTNVKWRKAWKDVARFPKICKTADLTRWCKIDKQWF